MSFNPAPKPAKYFFSYALVLFLTLLTPWRQLDWIFAGYLTPTQELDDGIVFVGVAAPVPTPESEIERFREGISSLLKMIASEGQGKPKAVLLDMQVRPSRPGLDSLVEAITTLQSTDVPVYGAVNPIDTTTGKFNRDYLNEHEANFYNDFLDGSGHTLIQRLGTTLKFDPYLDLGEGLSIPALPIKVAQDLFKYPLDPPHQSIVLKLGPHEVFARQSYRFEQGRLFRAEPTIQEEARPEWRDKILIVGNPAEIPAQDELPGGQSRPGPELVAWALSACISRTTSQLRAEPWLLAVYTLGLSAVASVVARHLLLRLPKLRRRAPILAPLAGGTSAAFCLGFAVWFLRQFNFIYPQLTLVLVGIAASSILTWLYLRRKIDSAVENARVLEEVTGFDVFVSYSRSHPLHRDWVETNIVKPLQQRVQKPDGSAIEVFFDKESLHAGQFWPERLAREVNTCRVFIPVYSDDYFEKAFCRSEIRHALLRYLPGELPIIPVMRSKISGLIPSEYKGIEYIDANNDARFRDKLIDAVRAAIHAAEVASLAGEAHLNAGDELSLGKLSKTGQGPENATSDVPRHRTSP